MQEQFRNVSWEVKTLRTIHKEVLEIKNTITEMNRAFEGQLISRPNSEKMISELEKKANRNFLIWNVKRKRTKKQKNKTKQNQNIPELWVNIKKSNITGKLKEKVRMGQKEYPK